jgi:hypothetical protein
MPTTSRPYDLCLHALVGILFLLGFATAKATIISDDRRITWQGNVGVPGGIPVRTTIYKTLSDIDGTGGTDVTSAIQSALNSCPSGQVVKLPAGTFKVNGTISIPSNVTLRGAGPGQTILNTFAGTNAVQLGSSTQYWYGSGTITDITSGYSKNSTSIVLASTTNVSIGSLLLIDQLNDSSFVKIDGGYGGGPATWVSRANGTRALGQTVIVTSISGKTVGVTPLYWDYSSSFSPQAVVVPASGVVTNAGVEDLTLRNNGTGNVNFFINAAAYCWIKNVEGDYCHGDHVSIENSYRCEVRHSNFHDAYLHTPGTYDSDVCVQYKSSGCLIEDNILRRLHLGVLMNRGASGNVVGYNLSQEHYDTNSPNVLIGDDGGHGAHPMFNLWEGNIDTVIWNDSVWGSNSHGTIFRNWVKGTGTHQDPTTAGRQPYDPGAPVLTSNQANRAIILDAQSRFFNVVGNILGTPSFESPDHYIAQWNASRIYDPDRYIFSTGYGGGGGGDGGGAPGDNTDAFTTLLNHGNYNSATGTQIWDPAISDHVLPNSLYLSAAPSWFGSLKWPPFNPATGFTGVSTISIPAGYRYVNGTDPGGTPSPTPTPTATPTPTPTPPPLALPTWKSTAGTITAPFVDNGDDTISQAIQTTNPLDGGKADYFFIVPNPAPSLGYTIAALVNCADGGSNSFFVNIDSEPNIDNNEWDIPVTTGLQSREVTLYPETNAHIWALTAGTHHLIVRGREANAILGRITFTEVTSPTPTPTPSPPQNLRILPP